MLASVLKPVDDTRMFEKIGTTLADSGQFEVSIIGYPSTGSSTHPEIKFYPLPSFERLSYKRLVAPWIIFKRINQVKPELIMINTPELLLVAILNRIFFGRKIVYDVLENHYQNIRYTSGLPWLARHIIAFVVRIAEIFTSPLFYHYILAEKGYADEMRFARPNIVLQNKLPKSVALKFTAKNVRGYTTLVFSGTLATSTGVFEAILLCKQLHKVDNTYSLTIVGHCALPEVLKKIKKEIYDLSFITLIGGEALVPHSRILEEISKADMGIIIYPPNPSTKSSIPTKLFEYLALQLPILIRHNEESHQLVSECAAGIVLSEAPDYIKLSATLQTKRFAPTVPDSIYWESEVQNFIVRLKLGHL